MERNCKYCKCRVEENDLLGIVHICRVKKKPITLDGYCQNFREIKKGEYKCQK